MKSSSLRIFTLFAIAMTTTACPPNPPDDEVPVTPPHDPRQPPVVPAG